MTTTQVGLEPKKSYRPFNIVPRDAVYDNEVRYDFVLKTDNKTRLYHYWGVDKYIFSVINSNAIRYDVDTLEEAEDIIIEHFKENPI